MLYHFYEMNHAAMAPMRSAAEAGAAFWENTSNPLSQTVFGRSAAASLHLFERMTRRYGKPEFGITETFVGNKTVAIHQENVWSMPFCNLVHFRKADGAIAKHQEKVLIVAPMSGHYATLLRNTVEGMLPTHDVYISDWADARNVPLAAGKFDLDDYTDYVINMLHHLGERAHVMAVCQPSVPVMAAVSLMSERDDALAPKSMILMGGPIDPRRNPTGVNKLAESKGKDWFRKNVIMTVPFPLPGMGRMVYPGFLQLTGFMTMNLDRHMTAHRDLFWHLVEGDGDSADKHRDFYDEYMSVMDLTAEFYLQTVERVFVHHDLPSGTYAYRGHLIAPETVTKTALLTVEGEKDDISGVGQTEAAHDILTGLPKDMKQQYLQKGVGHYGVFSGSRFRKEVVPVISTFIESHKAS
ncbi:MAG: polyhydroxyalkanoate depolymerase [Phyllobacteriaceae bacterium]|nr:polyhydroxyalkanoate depolymerase [Phyllobacteriaceae bacterium]